MPSNYHTNSEFLSISAIKDRGWTLSIINKLLGECDKTSNNPYNSQTKIKLYNAERVKEQEETEAFRLLKEKAQKRSLKMRESAGKKRNKLIKEACKNVFVQKITYETLKQLALDSKHNWYMTKNIYMDHNVYEADEFTIKRWMVNYARHELSNYDYVRIKYAGQIGVQEAASMFRREVMNQIGNIWPELEDYT